MGSLRVFIHGFLIGIANIIPGMSGGTLALVLGIYERLIGALRNIGFSTIKRVLGAATFKRSAVAAARAELQRVDSGFLVLLGVGAVAAVLVTSRLIVYLLNEHHDPTYGFFSGLILVSILIPVRMLRGFGWKEGCALLVAIGLILGLAVGTTEQQVARAAYQTAAVASVTGWELLLFFGSGALAISAMILPGISGSFLMLALGVYFPLLTAVNTAMAGVPLVLKGTLTSEVLESLLVIGVTSVGCLFGLIAFTRLLNYLLARYRNVTIAFLIGLMVGSLYGLWPFRAFVRLEGERVDTAHILPGLDVNLGFTFVAFLVGCGVIYLFMRLEDSEAVSV